MIVLLGAFFRTQNLFGWDGDSYLHPDERFIVFTTYNLSVPRSFSDYLHSQCGPNGYVTTPRNPIATQIPRVSVVIPAPSPTESSNR